MACPFIKLAEAAKCVKRPRLPAARVIHGPGLSDAGAEMLLSPTMKIGALSAHPQRNSMGVSMAGSKLLFTGQVMAARSSFSLFSAFTVCGIRILEVRR